MTDCFIFSHKSLSVLVIFTNPYSLTYSLTHLLTHSLTLTVVKQGEQAAPNVVVYDIAKKALVFSYIHKSNNNWYDIA